MTQDTGECPYRRLYIDISAWITDAKILSVFERTGHHGQYEGHKGSLLIPLATSVVTAASMLLECAINSHDECLAMFAFNQHLTPWVRGGEISRYTL